MKRNTIWCQLHQTWRDVFWRGPFEYVHVWMRFEDFSPSVFHSRKKWNSDDRINFGGDLFLWIWYLQLVMGLHWGLFGPTVKPDPPEKVVAKPVANNARRLEVTWNSPSTWPDVETFPLKYFLRYRPLIRDQWQHVSVDDLFYRFLSSSLHL